MSWARLDLDKDYKLSGYAEAWRCSRCNLPLWGNCITVSTKGESMADTVKCSCGEVNKFKPWH